MKVRFAAVGMVALAAIFGLVGIASAHTPDDHGNHGVGHTPVTICHWVGTDENGHYIVITIDDDGLHGHDGKHPDAYPDENGNCPREEQPTKTPCPTDTPQPTNTPTSTPMTPTSTSTSMPLTATSTSTSVPVHPATPTRVPATPTATSTRVIVMTSTSVAPASTPTSQIKLPDTGTGGYLAAETTHKQHPWVLLAVLGICSALGVIGYLQRLNRR